MAKIVLRTTEIDRVWAGRRDLILFRSLSLIIDVEWWWFLDGGVKIQSWKWSWLFQKLQQCPVCSAMIIGLIYYVRVVCSIVKNIFSDNRMIKMWDCLHLFATLAISIRLFSWFELQYHPHCSTCSTVQYLDYYLECGGVRIFPVTSFIQHLQSKGELDICWLLPWQGCVLLHQVCQRLPFF
mgnify:CR=1 FL=1